MQSVVSTTSADLRHTCPAWILSARTCDAGLQNASYVMSTLGMMVRYVPGCWLLADPLPDELITDLVCSCAHHLDDCSSLREHLKSLHRRIIAEVIAGLKLCHTLHLIQEQAWSFDGIEHADELNCRV